MKKLTSVLLSTLALLLLAGCASPARIDRMVAATEGRTIDAVARSSLRANTSVNSVIGGKETNPLWISNVSGADFERALEESLKAAGLLSQNRQASEYQINADLVKMDQPLFGIDMTVTAHVKYELIDRKNGTAVYKKELRIPFTATMGDAFLGVERLKIANEGAVKSNIKTFIEEIVLLDIPKNSVGN